MKKINDDFKFIALILLIILVIFLFNLKNI